MLVYFPTFVCWLTPLPIASYPMSLLVVVLPHLPFTTFNLGEPRACIRLKSLRPPARPPLLQLRSWSKTMMPPSLMLHPLLFKTVRRTFPPFLIQPSHPLGGHLWTYHLLQIDSVHWWTRFTPCLLLVWTQTSLRQLLYLRPRLTMRLPISFQRCLMTPS
jgi:hypothetical protein